MIKTEYKAADNIHSLTNDQLELIVSSRNDTFLSWLEDNSIFDVHRIRLMLELGQEAANSKLANNKE